ncbi:amino acid racemase [Patescibacteria group bacterium]|nr:amino acid racemase [Patescibacteria group bacterium]MBU1472877.1 amino acid racemase [Patescibacteria group bacterium]MBU2460061.1 amino acid racemase [Patescibacteria group bacterium]MBU2544757.1 amino acid racemase [Patescibacteria group bacterium]
MKTNKIIGVLGGMGPQASNEFYRLLISRAHQIYGAHNNNDYPEILMDSVPVPDFLADTKKQEQAARMLEERVEKMTNYGADIITMVCNTACILNDRLQRKTRVPIISVVEEVVKKVFIDQPFVLLLASPTSLRLGLYQLALARCGVNYIVPNKRDYQELEFIIRGVIDGKDRDLLLKKLVRLTERYLQKQKADGIVLGCTELPLVFPVNYRLPVYSSLSILADAVLKRYYKKEEV